MKTTTKLLVAFLVWNFVSGLFDARFEAMGGGAAQLWLYGSVLASMVLIFAWYVADSNALPYRRPRWMGVLMVFCALVAVPLYLFRSRPKGMRLKAMLRLLGYVVLCFVATAAGALIYEWVG